MSGLDRSLREQAAGIARGEIDPSDLLDECLDAGDRETGALWAQRGADRAPIRGQDDPRPRITRQAHRDRRRVKDGYRERSRTGV